MISDSRNNNNTKIFPHNFLPAAESPSERNVLLAKVNPPKVINLYEIECGIFILCSVGCEKL